MTSKNKPSDGLDEFGREIPDPTPIEIPIKLGKISDVGHVTNLARLVQREVSRLAQLNGQETLEEADDFEDEDGDDFSSPYEMSEMQEETPLPVNEAPKEPEKPSTGSKDDNEDEPEAE